MSPHYTRLVYHITQYHDDTLGLSIEKEERQACLKKVLEGIARPFLSILLAR